ncbi:GntR family transcriptional regulator [Jatrophihabitans sp. GAS493]|uniref:GntR family transcriptional regulator n=1 Tax=Jatrophihabitans sp. GAS493 TaxID=1907575 RepID=UPI0012FE6D1E|nr:GntR family transcriptional regulator [Jatrophihabitans sp. GAS493]
MTLSQLQNIAPVDRISVVEEVTTRLLHIILDGRLKAGDAVSEDEVKNALQVSRVTARSAIAELTARGILDKDANRPARVKTINHHEVRNLYRARMPVELEAVRFFTHRGGALDPGMEASIDALAEAEHSLGHLRIQYNLDFHRLLVAGTGNPWLLRCYTSIEGGLQLALAQSVDHPTCLETAEVHRALLKELTVGNWTHARDAMIEHLKESKRGVADSMNRSG